MAAPIVRTNHDELKQIGSQFGQEADAAHKLLQSLREHKDTLANGGWKGKGATAFLREMDSSILPSLANLHKALQQAQRVTAQISARLRQAEQDAAAVLQDRTELNANPADSGPASGAQDNGGGGFLSQVGGFFKGIGLGAWDTVTGLWQAVTNPVDTIKGLAYAVTHPGELWDAITAPYREAWARGDYGEAIGRGTFEVLSMLLPPGGGAAAKGVAKGADVAADVARVANVASDIARGADLAGDAARIANVAEDAAGIAGTINRVDGVFTGARYIPGEFDDYAREGARLYEQIVNTTGDTARIAESTGLSPSLLDQVKDHFFVREHDLPIGPNETMRANFTPDPESGRLWQMAERGELSGQQLADFNRWMGHEYVESRLMEAGLPYRSSHPDVVNNAMMPTRDHFGAHDLAPLMDTGRAPFAHYERLFPDLPQSLTLNDNLSNIDEVVDAIRKGLGK
jgi:WXG100 family type VII secretion target